MRRPRMAREEFSGEWGGRNHARVLLGARNRDRARETAFRYDPRSKLSTLPRSRLALVGLGQGISWRILPASGA